VFLYVAAYSLTSRQILSLCTKNIANSQPRINRNKQLHPTILHYIKPPQTTRHIAFLLLHTASSQSEKSTVQLLGLLKSCLERTAGSNQSSVVLEQQQEKDLINKWLVDHRKVMMLRKLGLGKEVDGANSLSGKVDDTRSGLEQHLTPSGMAAGP